MTNSRNQFDISSFPPHQKWGIRAPSDLRLSSPVPLSDLPAPKADQVLIRVLATSINYRDHLIVAHDPAYPGDHKQDLVIGSDGAGIVISLGPDAISSGLRPGDAVIVHPNTWLSGGQDGYDNDRMIGSSSHDGLLQRYAYHPVSRLLPDPSARAGTAYKLSAEETASIFTGGMTGYSCLLYGLHYLKEAFDPLSAEVVTKEGRLSIEGLKDKTVLVQGTGGVSLFAAQFAIAAGAAVIGTTSSKEKVEFLKGLGVRHVINYRETPDWDEEVLRLTDGKGVDIVVEVGGAGTILKSLKSTRFGGAVVQVGILTESVGSDIVPTLLYGGKTLRGLLGAGSLENHRAMMDFMIEKKIKPVVGKVFDFEQAKEGLAYAKSGQGVGKIVIRC